MSPSKIPEKLYYRFEEVVRLTRIDAETLESWEKEFPFLRSGLAGDGKKIYRAKDIEIIKRIKELLDGRSVTVAGARRKVVDEFGLRPTPSVHPDRMLKALWQVRDELQDLAETLKAPPKKN
jgi:DNA-binding transcriptional MerR regulator